LLCHFQQASTVASLLKQLLPYLQSYKRQRAAFVLEHYEALTPRNGKYTTVGLERRHRFEEALLAMTATRTVNVDFANLHATLGIANFDPQLIDELKRDGRP